MKTMGTLLLVVAAVLLRMAPACAQTAPTTQPAMKCAAMVDWKIPGSTMVITRATAVPESRPDTVQYMPPFPMKVAVAIPSYCKVEGELDRRVGQGGINFAVGFAVALPDRWNGRFLFQGGGGFNGSVLPPLGTAAAGNTPGLARGFAVVSTDDGHKGTIWDTSFMADQEAALDFANDTVPKVTRTAKAIIAHYYGRYAAHSYFAGCSTGGREGMEASERLPEEYDGIVVGDPAMEVRMASLGQNWFNYVLTQIAPKDASGKPDPAHAFSASDRKLVHDGVLKACDALDGVKDGLIFNVGACHFDPAVLQCQGAKTESCLSADQIGALKKAFAGPVNSRGKHVYTAFPWDSGITAEGRAPGILTNAAATFGPKYHETLSVDTIVDTAAADGIQQLTDTVHWTELNTFFARGGKVLYYHGVSDPYFSALDTLDYYQRMAKDSGGMDTVRAQSSRFYFVPGMLHCRGGPSLDSFDLLGAVVDWVEKGKAPEGIVATGGTFPGRSRPLCPWPEYTQYKGSGNSEDAANFACQK
jgi:Tannase and feruloyl esterase